MGSALTEVINSVQYSLTFLRDMSLVRHDGSVIWYC